MNALDDWEFEVDLPVASYGGVTLVAEDGDVEVAIDLLKHGGQTPVTTYIPYGVLEELIRRARAIKP